METTIQDIYVDALLAELSYEDLDQGGIDSTALPSAVMPEIASYFRVAASYPGSMGDGFNATVFRQVRSGDFVGSPSGSIVIAMRGTLGYQDIRDDIDLTFGGPAGLQILNMLNWWSRITTPSEDPRGARQFAIVSQRVREPVGLDDGRIDVLVEAARVPGTGEITAGDLTAGRVTVVGHSLGGFLASAFTRLLGNSASVDQAVTFNSAGFARIYFDQIVSAYQQVVGAQYGRPEYPDSNGESQINVYGLNGISVTTNESWFQQLGYRFGVANEEGYALGNHRISRVVDYLALAAAMQRIDPGITREAVNNALSIGKWRAEESLEDVLDGMRQLLLGPRISRTMVGYSTDTAARESFYSNLYGLLQSESFSNLRGLVRLRVADESVATDALSHFSSVISLLSSSPVAISANSVDAEASLNDALRQAWGEDIYVLWEDDQRLTADQRAAGLANFSDNWLEDRSLMMRLVAQGLVDPNRGAVAVPGARSQHFYDLTTGVNFDIGLPANNVEEALTVFGTENGDEIIGRRLADHLYGGGGIDQLSGNEGDDHLEGNVGNDRLDGGNGHDTLAGGGGDDILNGGSGNDLLAGGQGADRYVIDANSDIDSITSSDAEDRLEFAGRVLTGAGTVRSRVGATTVWVDNSDAGHEVIYEFDFAAHELLISGYGSTVVVHDFADGDLGIHIPADSPRIVDPITADADYVSGIEREADGLSGSDVLIGRAGSTTSGPLSQTLNGEAGNDLIFGLDGDDTLDGGSGNDFINGGRGHDLIFGGSGDDLIIGQINYLNVGPDAIASAPNEARPVSWRDIADTWTWQWDSGSVDERIQYFTDIGHLEAAWRVSAGWSGFGLVRDSNQSSADADMVFGGDGNDNISGGDGDDLLSGDSGNDVVFGNSGDDVLRGGAGNDELEGAEGDDRLDGGDGRDRLFGDVGADRITGGSGDDVIFGDLTPEGNAYTTDVDFGAMGDDVIDAGSGADFVSGGAGADLILGGDGADLLLGDGQDIPGQFQGNDYIDGGAGIDRVVGGGGNDTLNGGTGDDVLIGDGTEVLQVEAEFEGADVLDGGEGDDVLVGGGGNDVLLGGDGKDLLFGQAGNDVLVGDRGVDGLFGGADDDTLVSDGNDVLAGGEGNDHYVITTQAATRSPAGTYVVTAAQVDDSEGINSIEVDGISIDEAQVFVQEGRTFVRVGGGLVELTDRTSLSSTTLQSDGAQPAVTLQQIVASNSPSGLIRTGVWSAANGVVINTGQIHDAQTINGGVRNEWVEGGSGEDLLDGGLGNDRVEGGDGADRLYGGAGEDLIVSGAGDDALFGSSPTADDGASDIFLFNRGDGQDYIGNDPVSASPEARDVIRFGEGISRADLTVSNLSAGNGSTFQLAIRYGNDQIVLAEGEEGNIAEIQFSDGSSWSMSDVVAAARAADDGATVDPREHRIVGTAADDVLLGTSADEVLLGLDGDDTLEGRGGYDLLEGGAGRNLYRFRTDSGADQVQGTLGETGILQFDVSNTSTLRFWQDGHDLVIGTASNQTVRLVGFNDVDMAGVYDAWRIADGAGRQTRLSTLLRLPTPPDAGATSALGSSDADMEASFVDAQLSELRNLPRGYVGQDLLVASGVTTVELSGSDLAVPSYLTVETRTTSTTFQQRTPNYTSRWVRRYTYVPVEGSYVTWFSDRTREGGTDWNGTSTVFLPSQYELRGVDIQEQWQSGWTTSTQTVTTTSTSGFATLSRVLGTQGDDNIRSAGANQLGAALFRGTIDSLGGNDVINLSSGYLGGSYDRTRDWAAIDEPWRSGDYGSQLFSQLPSFYNHGLGAWINAGSGDDHVTGSDGNDVIIGGEGSDYLDGQAGSDRYRLGFEAGAIDHISDLAALSAEDQAAFDAWNQQYFSGVLLGYDDEGAPYYGNALHQAMPNTDSVEFDSTVRLADLSYRWIEPQGDGAQRTLELRQHGEVFLRIDYGAASDAGVENFSFADGHTFSRDELLTLLPAVELSAVGTLHDDRLTGGVGNTLYSWGAGAGNDSIEDQGGTDRLELTAGTDADEIWFERDGDDLRLTLESTGERLGIRDWYSSTNHRIESIVLADGKRLLATDVQNLVDAMAQFSGPSAGSPIPPHERNVLTPVIAANWHSI